MGLPDTKVQKYLDARGMKQKFLVDNSGLSHPVVSGICSGRINPHEKEKELIATALSVKVEEVFDG